LLKHGVIVGSQMEKLVEATRQLKQRYKFVTPENLRTTNLLTEFMEDIGEEMPTWNAGRVQESLEGELKWIEKQWPLSKYILHCVSANRQEMTKCVKLQIKCMLWCMSSVACALSADNLKHIPPPPLLLG
jgi:hypothetical protein